jgi:beta-glucosidase
VPWKRHLVGLERIGVVAMTGAGVRRITSGRVARRRRTPVVIVAALALAGLAVMPAAKGASPGSSCPWVGSTAPIPQRVAQLMGKMSLSNKLSMVEGHGTNNPYVFYTPAISSLCIPAFGLEDGPAGVADGLTGVTQLPAGVALAATWDPSMAQQYGQVSSARGPASTSARR